MACSNPSERSDVADTGVVREHPLYLGGRDVIAAADDDVLDPVQDVAASGRVEASEIAGAKPSVAVDDRSRGRGVAPVSGSHLRSAHAQFALDIGGGHQAAVRAQHGNLAVRHGKAGRGGVGSRKLRWQVGRERRSLGEPPCLLQREPVVGVGQHQTGRDRRAGHDGTGQ